MFRKNLRSSETFFVEIMNELWNGFEKNFILISLHKRDQFFDGFMVLSNEGFLNDFEGVDNGKFDDGFPLGWWE